MLALATATLAALHLVGDSLLPRSPGLIDLDGERNLPTLYSAALLLVSGAAFSLLVQRRILPRSTLALATLFLLMSADEALTVHESLERSSGIDWQLLYAPLILAGGLAALHVLHVIPSRSASMLLLIGIAAWGESQILEFAQWDGDIPRLGYGRLMFAEEVLEMLGSALFLLSALSLLVSGDHPARLGRGANASSTVAQARSRADRSSDRALNR